MRGPLPDILTALPGEGAFKAAPSHFLQFCKLLACWVHDLDRAFCDGLAEKQLDLASALGTLAVTKTPRSCKEQ